LNDYYTAAEQATIKKYLEEQINHFNPSRAQGPPPLNIGGGFPPLPAKKDSRISLDAVKWLVKGGAPAPPDAGFAYCFSTDKDGHPNEYADLVDYIKQSGPVKLEDYTYSLSKDGKFLQRSREVARK
jgi:hypothetical protein